MRDQHFGRIEGVAPGSLVQRRTAGCCIPFLDRGPTLEQRSGYPTGVPFRRFMQRRQAHAGFRIDGRSFPDQRFHFLAYIASHRPVQRRETEPVGLVDPGAFLDQDVNRFGSVQPRRQMQRRYARTGAVLDQQDRCFTGTGIQCGIQGRKVSFASPIDLRPARDQQPRRLVSVVQRGLVERCRTIVVHRIDRCTACDQQLRRTASVAQRGFMQRRRASIVPGIDPRPARDQELRHRAGVAHCSFMQRSEAGRALRIQLRLVCDQQLRHLAIVAPCRKMQRYFTVPVSLVGALDIAALAQHPRQPIAPAFAVASQLCVDGRAVVEEVSCQREVAQNHRMVKVRPAVFVRMMRGKLASQQLGELSSPFSRGQRALSAFHPSRHVLSKSLAPSLAQPPLPNWGLPVRRWG